MSKLFRFGLFLEDPRIRNIWKCKGLVFAQFLSNTRQSSSSWPLTTQILNEKYQYLIFVKNLGDVHGQNTWMGERNLNIAFLTVAPFIVKFRFEKYRYLFTHLLCIQIFRILLYDSHSTDPQNQEPKGGQLVPSTVLYDVMILSYITKVKLNKKMNAKYFVWKMKYWEIWDWGKHFTKIS